MGETRALNLASFSVQIWLGPVSGPMFRYVLRTPFVGRRLRVSNFFFGRYRFRHIVIFFVDYSHQFHPEIEFPGLCAWWLGAFPIHQEKSYDSPTQTRISYDASAIKYSRPKNINVIMAAAHIIT